MQSNPSGSVAVVVALLLTILLGIMAFTMDAGYLYLKKNQYQNAVEAAAMAGAGSLCEENPENVAREIAIENIPGLEAELEEDGAVLTIQTGFYDENDTYADFGTYKDFVASDDPAFPDGEYNNAVMVSLALDNSGLTGMMPLSKDSDESAVTIRAAAVAYLRAYGMLSLGEEAGDGIFFTNYADNEPTITNGGLHANNDITFEAPPTIDTTSVRISAGGNISGYGGGTSAARLVDLKPVSAYLEDLYARADKVITEDDFPPPGAVDFDNAQTDEFGNTYSRINADWGGERIIFHPHAGDHDGRIYYFSSDGQNIQLANPEGNEDEITNFTFVSEAGITYHPSNMNFKWGGENEKQVALIAAEDIDFCGDPSQQPSSSPGNTTDGRLIAMGMVAWAGKDILWRNAYSFDSDYQSTRQLRMVAGGSIIVVGPEIPSVSIGYEMKFGPPCPPYDILLGRLITP